MVLLNTTYVKDHVTISTSADDIFSLWPTIQNVHRQYNTHGFIDSALDCFLPRVTSHPCWLSN